MIIEHALLSVRPGQEGEFEVAMASALPIIESAPGCRGAEVRAQVEDPSTYLLLVRWDTLEDHVDGFRGSKLFERWRELTHRFYIERPEVTHFGEPLGR
jgi:heme-degrading monooxygenase HmoA